MKTYRRFQALISIFLTFLYLNNQFIALISGIVLLDLVFFVLDSFLLFLNLNGRSGGRSDCHFVLFSVRLFAQVVFQNRFLKWWKDCFTSVFNSSYLSISGCLKPWVSFLYTFTSPNENLRWLKSEDSLMLMVDASDARML